MICIIDSLISSLTFTDISILHARRIFEGPMGHIALSASKTHGWHLRGRWRWGLKTLVFWKDFLGKKSMKYRVVSLNFANSPVANCKKTWRKSFLKRILKMWIQWLGWSSLTSKRLLQVNPAEIHWMEIDGDLPTVMEIMYPGHSTWTPNTFSPSALRQQWRDAARAQTFGGCSGT